MTLPPGILLTKLEEIAIAPAVEFGVGGKAALYQESSIDASGLWLVVQVLSHERLKVRKIGGDDEAIVHYSLLRPVDDRERVLAELRKGGEATRCPRCDSPDPKRHPAVQFEGEVQICPDPFHGPADHNTEQPIPVAPVCEKHPGVTADQLDEGDCPSCIAERRAENERSRQKQEERERRADERYVAGLAERAATLYQAMRDSFTPRGGVRFSAETSTALAAAMLLAERLDNIEEQLRQIGLSLDRMDR